MIEALPAGGFVLQVNVAVERPLAGKRGITWPPRIRAADVGGVEGVSSRYGVYQLFAAFGQREAYVWAVFVRRHTSVAQLTAATEELRTVHLL